ncbi:MAG: N-acetylmuramoyl-L-alanine amidase [Mycolicibacterium sp.]|nr:N-acetylmuramoyl-L-alanine amidase [Mycolicibacterium sp.]
MTTNAGTNPPDSGSSLSRRRLLQWTGVAGAAAVVSACSNSATPRLQAAPTPTVVPAVPSSQPLTAAVPVPAPSPAPAAMAKEYLCRDSWGALAPLGPGRKHTISQMTIHHTAVVLGDNSNMIARLQQHQRYHQNEKGWIDIAYHMAVDRHGNIFELRDWNLAGDTATNYETAGHFLVVCEGNFDEEPISERQLDSAALAFAWATQQFPAITGSVKGHQQVAPGTSCPGADLQARVTNGELQRRIDFFRNAGPVDLQRICGPQALATVAAIQGGA